MVAVGLSSAGPTLPSLGILTAVPSSSLTPRSPGGLQAFIAFDTKAIWFVYLGIAGGCGSHYVVLFPSHSRAGSTTLSCLLCGAAAAAEVSDVIA